MPGSEDRIKHRHCLGGVPDFDGQVRTATQEILGIRHAAATWLSVFGVTVHQISTSFVRNSLDASLP